MLFSRIIPSLLLGTLWHSFGPCFCFAEVLWYSNMFRCMIRHSSQMFKHQSQTQVSGSVIFNCVCLLHRDAQNTNPVRQRLHLQGVHLPVCQLLLFTILRGFLQRKVSYKVKQAWLVIFCTQLFVYVIYLYVGRFVGYPTNYGTLFGMRNEDVSL